MRIVIEGDESKRLEHASLTFSHRMQHFRHALDTAGLSLKRNFHEIAFREASCKLQQSAIDGNDLDVALGILAIAELNDYGCGCKFDATSTMGRVGLGIMCHAGTTMALGRRRGEITEAQCPDSWSFRALTRDFHPFFSRFSPHTRKRLWEHSNQVGCNQRALTDLISGNIACQAMQIHGCQNCVK